MGWQGRILRVDLTAGTAEPEALNTQWAEKYLGERGLASKYLYEETSPTCDALSPENNLIFATGPLTGTMASTAGRFVVVTKSPLTGAIACSNSGGKFGAELKFAGYDMLIVEGRAKNPVYLHIEDDAVSILPAGEIWGESVWETDAWLKEAHGDPQMRVAAIGVAGEKGVLFASIINDLHRAAGRSGVGAVMGSKNLKAVSVRGSVGVAVNEPARFMEVVAAANKKVNESGGRKGLGKSGTNMMMASMQAFGALPTRNFKEVEFEGADKVGADAMREADSDGHRNLITNKACFGCTIACGRIAHIKENHFTIVNRPEYRLASGGLEYETAFAFGPAIGVDDIDALTFASFLSNEHGFDPISFGVTLAAAMELFEMGVISEKDTDGVPLIFGNAEALTVMAEKTGKGEGFGKILALGSKRMCEHYGHGELSMSVKGQEFAAYDGRALQGMGLGFATSNRGACHLKHSTFAEDREDQTGKGKAQACKASQDKIAFKDSAGICLFADVGWGDEDYAALIDAALPGRWTAARLIEIGERVWTLERLFNLKAGLSAKDDTLPPRLLNDPAPSGTAKGRVSELPKMLPEYYGLRGWTEDGKPTSETLLRLDL